MAKAPDKKTILGLAFGDILGSTFKLDKLMVSPRLSFLSPNRRFSGVGTGMLWGILNECHTSNHHLEFNATAQAAGFYQKLLPQCPEIITIGDGRFNVAGEECVYHIIPNTAVSKTLDHLEAQAPWLLTGKNRSED